MLVKTVYSEMKFRLVKSLILIIRQYNIQLLGNHREGFRPKANYPSW